MRVKKEIQEVEQTPQALESPKELEKKVTKCPDTESRKYFAGQVLPSVYSKLGNKQQIAKECIAMADALIKELK